jgi:hypothetical protein
MYTTLLLHFLFSSSLAAPLAQRDEIDTWEPAIGSNPTCDTTSDKIIGFYVGPQLETVVNDACAEMMEPCAYQERLPAGTACTKSIVWPLKDSQKSTQSANVESRDGNKISGWGVQCKSSSICPLPERAH